MTGKQIDRNLLDKVYFGDVMDLFKKIPSQSVDMVFGDPDYNVGVKYGDKTYTKDFNEYVEWYIELARESLRVLKNTGNLFFINYPRQNAHLRVKYLEDACFDVHDYVWVYNTNIGHSPRRLTTAHRSILHCRKSNKNNFYKDHVAQPYQNPNDRRIRSNLASGSKGRMPYSWLYFDLVKNVSCEKSLHACQIPKKLSELLMLASTNKGDTVFVLFGGSGSELEVCQKLGRHFISAEIDKKYIEIINARLKNGGVTDEHRMISRKKNSGERAGQLSLGFKK
ncbi:MAG TPA: site-specific DNA-methyltransferase [Spirochaetes bacterium]|nr:site-specific DNA-methyltransferase [Spirochaetota bacterium]